MTVSEYSENFIVLKQKILTVVTVAQDSGGNEVGLGGSTLMIIKTLEETLLVIAIHQIILRNSMTLYTAFPIPSGTVKTIWKHFMEE